MGGGATALRHGEGFTVVELVIAAVILLFTVTAAISGIVVSDQAEQMAERRTEALNIANQQIELARNLGYDDVATVVPSNGLPAGKIPNVQTVGAYTVNISIAYGTYGASSAASYKTISVVVSWNLPLPGSVTVSSDIAGASGMQDYNFGTVTLAIQDEGNPPQGVAGVTVQLTDSNNRTYQVMTTASGIAQFTYVPSGNVTFTASAPGYLIDTVTAPVCVANTTTAYGPVTAHVLQTGIIQFVSSAGVPTGTVGLSAGPSLVTSVPIDATGKATFSGLIKGSYTIAVACSSYQLAAPAMLNIGTLNTPTITLAVKPAIVTATRTAPGTVYVWNAVGTLNTSAITSASKPYSAVFSLTGLNIQPTLYYFTTSNAFATTTSATVSPGQTYSVAVK